jgi:hypothetical protein
VPEGVKGRYLLKWARSEGPKIIEAQQQISRTSMAPRKGKKFKRRLKTPLYSTAPMSGRGRKALFD